VITAVAVVLLGVFPGAVVDWAGPTGAPAMAVTAAALGN
jgi:uncharacterized membrane protein